MANQNKNITSWTNDGEELTQLVLLIGNGFQLLIDSTYKLLIGGSGATPWTNTSKS